MSRSEVDNHRGIIREPQELLQVRSPRATCSGSEVRGQVVGVIGCQRLGLRHLRMLPATLARRGERGGGERERETETETERDRDRERERERDRQTDRETERVAEVR